MTVPELLADVATARSGDVVWTRTRGLTALIVYEAAEAGTCDGCGATFAAGDAIVGQHEHLDDSSDFDPEVAAVYCCRECVR